MTYVDCCETETVETEVGCGYEMKHVASSSSDEDNRSDALCLSLDWNDVDIDETTGRGTARILSSSSNGTHSVLSVAVENVGGVGSGGGGGSDEGRTTTTTTTKTLTCFYRCGYCRWRSLECGVSVSVLEDGGCSSTSVADELATVCEMRLDEVEGDLEDTFRALVAGWGQRVSCSGSSGRVSREIEDRRFFSTLYLQRRHTLHNIHVSPFVWNRLRKRNEGVRTTF